MYRQKRKKSAFIRLPQSQNNCTDLLTLFSSMEVQLGAENPPGTVYKYRIDRLFPAPTPKPLCRYEGRAINTIPEEQFLNTKS
jgi:hypothetical protein